MSEATPLQDAQWRAIEAVNALVECDASWEDRYDAIDHVLAHLQARLEQTTAPTLQAVLAECVREQEQAARAFMREHIVVAVVGDNTDLL